MLALAAIAVFYERRKPAGVKASGTLALRNRAALGASGTLALRMAALLLFAALWASCGGGGGGGGPQPPSDPGTPGGSYTVTVTGISGSLTHQTQLTLTVQ